MRSLHLVHSRPRPLRVRVENRRLTRPQAFVLGLTVGIWVMALAIIAATRFA